MNVLLIHICESGVCERNILLTLKRKKKEIGICDCMQGRGILNYQSPQVSIQCVYTSDTDSPGCECVLQGCISNTAWPHRTTVKLCCSKIYFTVKPFSAWCIKAVQFTFIWY